MFMHTNVCTVRESNPRPFEYAISAVKYNTSYTFYPQKEIEASRISERHGTILARGAPEELDGPAVSALRHAIAEVK
jgi:hypothetical protein